MSLTVEGPYELKNVSVSFMDYYMEDGKKNCSVESE